MTHKIGRMGPRVHILYYMRRMFSEGAHSSAFDLGLFSISQISNPLLPGSYPFFVVAIPVWVSSRISGGLTPLRRVDFLPFEKLIFFEIMLSKFPQFSTEQLLETSESEDPDFLGTSSLSA